MSFSYSLKLEVGSKNYYYFTGFLVSKGDLISVGVTSFSVFLFPILVFCVSKSNSYSSSFLYYSILISSNFYLYYSFSFSCYAFFCFSRIYSLKGTIYKMILFKLQNIFHFFLLFTLFLLFFL